MPRIAGIDIPADKRIVIALTYVYGIGKALSQKILKGAYIEKNFSTEGQLRRQEMQNIVRMKSINCYRGIRHKVGLPVRGQRTKTNARTRKGRKKTVAGKKSVKELG